jgi:hypothetical protein
MIMEDPPRKKSKFRMYILIRESIPLGFALVGAAHASLATFLKFKDAPETQNWLAGPFYKTICKVTDEEFERAKTLEDHVVLTESQLDNQEVAIAFKPREEYPKSFQFFRLYR